ncbi:hypothetical protein ABCW43_02260 [Neorhizobium sp. IRAMC:178]|uniref:hypothetical protein n=1 Tax=Neorhizobium tunisiense TaxID=3144793 RepID=UPI0031F6F5E9
MPVTEFDDSEHYGLFLTNPNRLDSTTVMRVRMSELTLAALRAAGVLDNMVDGTSAPATDKLWLDKNFDPAVLKEWDATGASWVPMTFDRLFGRAAVGLLTVTGGTGNAVVVSEPSGFKADRLYLITPTANNTTAVTIQVAGVGTYAAKYGDGSDLLSGEFATGRQSVLLFDGVKFVVVFSIAGLNAYVAAAAASASAAATSETNAFGFAGLAAGSASAAATSASNAASAAAAVLTGATSDDTFADANELIYLDGATAKRGTLLGLISSIFTTARTIASAQFASASFKLFNAAGTPRALTFDTTALTADRAITMPNANVNLGDIITPDIKAFVNFNGTGTPAIRSSRNVSSITDLGTGYFRVNFTASMADTNYATFISVGMSASTAAQAGKTFAKNVAWVEILVTNSSGPTVIDMDDISVEILR